MIPFAMGVALVRLAGQGSPTPQANPGQAPPPEKAIQTPISGPQAPKNPTGDLGPRPLAAPPRTVDPQVPPPVVLPVDPNADVPPGPLTAQEAGRIALRLQPSILSARGALQTARGTAQITASDLNPQATAGAGYTNQGIASGLGGPSGAGAPGASALFPLSASLGVSQLLFDFNQTRNLVRRDRALADAVRADLDLASLNALNDVEGAFYTLANDRRLVLVAEADVVNRQRQLELARARLGSGLGLPIDLATAESSKAAAIQALVQARNTENQDRVGLLQLMGVNPFTPLEASQLDEPPVDDADPRGLATTGLQRRPEVRAAALSVAAFRYGLSAARASNLPVVVGTFGGGLGGTSFAGSYGTSIALGIGLQFPVFDGGRRRGAIRAAEGRITGAEADLRTAVLRVQSDVASAVYGLRAAEQRVVTAEAQAINSGEAVRIAEGRYANGLGLFQDITTAQSQLNAALQDQSTARSALNLARVRVRYATAQLILG